MFVWLWIHPFRRPTGHPITCPLWRISHFFSTSWSLVSIYRVSILVAISVLFPPENFLWGEQFSPLNTISTTVVLNFLINRSCLFRHLTTATAFRCGISARKQKLCSHGAIRTGSRSLHRCPIETLSPLPSRVPGKYQPGNELAGLMDASMDAVMI